MFPLVLCVNCSQISQEMNLHDQRTSYNKSELSEDIIQQDPFDQFMLWFKDVQQTSIREANAMTIATATSEGKPSARIVLLKEVNERGFVFYTNYDSRKGKELAENPHAQLLFFWDDLERQIRIEGTIEKLPADISDAYGEPIWCNDIGSKHCDPIT